MGSESVWGGMIEVVCGIIVGQSGKVLVCRRDFKRHLGGKWEFPGGKVNHGESASEALVREVEEELGITIVVKEVLGTVVEWADGDVSIRLRGFRCEIVGGEPVALEHEEIRWCEFSELRDLDWAEADVPLVDELLSETAPSPKLD